MSVKRQFIFGLCALGLAVPATTAFASDQFPPAPGFYTASVYVVEATGPENSCEFVALTGQTYTGIFYYPGARRLGANLRVPSATDNGPNVYIHEFPRTPHAEATTWSGAGQEGFEGNNALMPTSFNANIVRLDESSFSMTMSVNVTVSSGNVCSYGVNIALARAGNAN